MKKLCGIFGIVLVSVLFFSCDFFGSDGGSDLELITESANGKGKNCFVQVNYSQLDIKKTSTAYVTSSANASSQVEDDDSSLSLLAKRNIMLNGTYLDVTEKTSKKAFTMLKKSSKARAATVSSRPTGYVSSEHNVGSTDNFYIQDFNENDVTRTGTLKAKGEYCDVWFIHNAITKDGTVLVSASDIDFEEIAAKFDLIYGVEKEILGTIDITADFENIIKSPTKVVVIVADLLEDASISQKGGVYGYVNPVDFFSDSWAKTNDSHSNECCAIYLDSYFYKTDKDSIYSTIAHEFNHALNFTNKVITKENEKSQDSYEVWFTEMLAMLAEDMCTNLLGIEDNLKKDSEGNLTGYNTVYASRLPWFLAFYNLGFYTWRDTATFFTQGSGADVYASYGNAYAFGSYLVRNYGGFELLHELATSNYFDEEAITKGIAACGNNVTFKKALLNFPKIILGDPTYTLNKTRITWSKNSKIYFEPINISLYTDYVNLIKDSIYYNNSKDSYYRRFLGAYGFDCEQYKSGIYDCNVIYPEGYVDYYFY